MLRKIYKELVGIRKELQAIRGSMESFPKKITFDRVPYGRSYQVSLGQPCNMETPEWRRFELLAETDGERERLEKILDGHSLSRQDLAVILFGLRVRPGFGKKDFGI